MIEKTVDKDDTGKYKEMRNIFQKSIVSLVDIPSGTEITREMISTKKPGGGLHPRYFEVITGKKVKKDSFIFEEDIEW